MIKYLELIRAPNFFTVVSNIVAAHIIASGNLDATIVLYILVSACLYHGGMIINDFADFKTDLIENPNRPIPSGKITRVTALILGTSLFSTALIIAYFIGQTTFIISVALLLSILLYDLVIKEGLAGSLTMALCRYLNWILGMSVVPLTVINSLIPITIFIYIASLTYISKQETLSESYTSLVLGCIGLGIAFAILVILAALNTGGLSNLSTTLACVLILYVGIPIYNCIKDFTPDTTRTLIKTLVLGIIPLDALITAINGFEIAGLLIMTLMIPSNLLAKRLYVT